MLTRSRLAQLPESRVDEVTLATPPRRPPLGRWLTEPLAVTGRWPRRLGLAWFAIFATAVAIEPPPANPNAPDPAWASLLFFGLLAAIGVMSAGLSRRQRFGLVASVVAGGLALMATVMCPVSGHHESIGAWWYLQMVGFTGLIGASLMGIRRSRRAGAA